MRKDEVLHRDKEKKIILHTARRRKGNWVGHVLCRNCLLKHSIMGKREVTGKRGRRHEKLLDDLKEMRGYWILKIEVLDHTL